MDASFKDMALQMCQDEMYSYMINNEDVHVDSGLNYQNMIKRAHKAQIFIGRDHTYTTVLKHGDIYKENESVLEHKLLLKQMKETRTIIYHPKILRWTKETKSKKGCCE